ncbi:MAG: Holliday junction resolvase RuvX [Rhodobacteraceae bacterium]|nr:Holliday junction resolvase RuvX [Paracoccaceae bacterium]
MNPVAIQIGEFFRALPPAGPLIGIDHGSKTLGIAVSDHDRRMAAPLTTIRGKTFRHRVNELLKLCTERETTGIVIGYPRNMDGTEGRRCQSVKAFAHNLSRLTTLPITFFDERLSTAEAEAQLCDAGVRRQQRANLVDQVAAAIILQDALDMLARTGEPH